MTTIRRRFTEDSWHKEPWFRALCTALRSCETDDDMANFLRDIGTLSELQAWSERLEVAKQLAQGFSYRQVAKNTGASTTTVTRVAKFIENGEGGYRKFLNVHRHHRLHTKPANAHSATVSELPARLADDTTQVAGSTPVQNKPASVLQKYLQK